MLFNTLEFALYLPIVFILYWFVFNKNLKWQNGLIVLASYVFYGWWDWRFLSLIIFSSLIDYYIGLALASTCEEKKRKRLLYLSMLVNLGFLGMFKYFNFFSENFAEAFTFFGKPIDSFTLNVILPVGISFYTFQTMSYTIDVYKKKLVPTKDIFSFLAFVSFFPQLVAGPIERATNLLPQFYRKRKFDNSTATDGLYQILWGLFKKVAIADQCSILVNAVFDDYHSYDSMSLIGAAILFAFQIYCDFSGYSDIAIGTSKLFGFKLMKNFAYPYFSRDIAEFWRRWHISLSTWFRDYVYIPLGGSKVETSKKIRNIFIIFILSGFWHGANWTYIFWGALNAIYFLPSLLKGTHRKNIQAIADNQILPGFGEFFRILKTFFLTVVAWVFFRSETLTGAFDFLIRSLTNDGENNYYVSLSNDELLQFLFTLILITVLVFYEWISRTKDFVKVDVLFSERKKPILTLFMATIFITIILIQTRNESVDFIYFQF